VLILGVVIWLLLKSKPVPKPTKKITNQTITTTPVTTNSTTTQYISNGTDLNLSFYYPTTWTVTPASNNNKTDQAITLTTPLTTITNADGSSVSGKILIQVRPGTSSITELNTNSPVTAIASAQIAYSKPTTSQTTYPFLTYVHYSNASKASGAFEEVIITGGQSLPAKQSISAQNFTGIDPIITSSFFQCSSQTCTGVSQTPLSITTSLWQNDLIFQQVLTVLESFQLN
jgi:hypothetical protein